MEHDEWQDHDEIDDKEMLEIPICAATGGSEEDKDPPQKEQAAMPLKALRSGYLWVSDLVSQTWCEQQMVYKFTMPTVKVDKPVVTAGTDMHLARELEVQDSIPVEVTSSEDIFAVKVLNLISHVGSLVFGAPVVREIPIFGAPFGQGVFLMGMIDEIKCDAESMQYDILEFKTRGTRSLPSKAQKMTNKLQVMLYKRLLDDLIIGTTNKDSIKTHMKLDLQRPFGDGILGHIKKIQFKEQTNLDALLDTLFDKVQNMTCISQLLVEYSYQEDKSTIAIESVDYDDEWLSDTFKKHVNYWKGKRNPVGVDIEDAWKCQHCDFSDVCEWRSVKAKECVQKNVLSSPVCKKRKM